MTDSTSSARKLLASKLAAAPRQWTVIEDARAIDTVRKDGACVLWTSKRSRVMEMNRPTYLRDDVTLWALTGASDPTRIEDDLDELLLAVLDVIEAEKSFTWSEAERGQLEDKFPGWRVTVSALYRITH